MGDADSAAHVVTLAGRPFANMLNASPGKGAGLKRREFITFLVGAAWSWPFAARGQQPGSVVIGFLCGASAAAWVDYLAGFRTGLREAGYVEGQSVHIEYRWAEGHYDLLPSLAADLVKRKVAVLVSTGGQAPAMAAKAATSTIPIVFTIGGDPVQLGLVSSLNQPGGNVTGVNMFVPQMESKRFGLLRALLPGASLITMLLNPTNPPSAEQMKEVQDAARATGQRVEILHASSERELEAAFANAFQLHAAAMQVGADPYFNSKRDKIIALAAQYRMPAIYEQREHAVAGGLMSYGTNLTEGYRQAGIYVGRILKGEKPATLPVLQSAKFEFVINLKVAKALDIQVPPSLSAEADEIIE